MAWRSTWNEPPEGGRGGFFVDRGGLFPPGVKLVLILTVGVFLLEAIGMGPWLFAYGDLSVSSLLRLEVWRLVTYMFIHASTNHILLNMFFFWMLGAAFERQVGTKPFLALYLASGVAGGLGEAGFNAAMYVLYNQPGYLSLPAVGASAGVAGLLVAFATLNPRAKFYVMFVLPMEAWLFALAYAAIETWPIAQDLLYGPSPLRDDKVAHAAHFGGMAMGFVWMKWGAALAARGSVRGQREREHVAWRTREEEQVELDRILQKVHDEGVDSLTSAEKLFLQEMSDKYRDRL